MWNCSKFGWDSRVIFQQYIENPSTMFISQGDLYYRMESSDEKEKVNHIECKPEDNE